MLERERPADAEQEFRFAIEQEKRAWPEAQYDLGKALERQKRHRESGGRFRSALEACSKRADPQTMGEYIDYLRRKK